MIFDWFDAKNVEAFGTELATIVINKIPPGVSTKKDLTLSKRKELLNKLVHKIEQFKRHNKLNLYKKAKFGTALQWSLKDAGYDAVFINELTKELLLKF